MAKLPSEQYVIQQNDGEVRLFEDGSERLLVSFDPSSPADVTTALEAIATYGLDDQDTCFAYFWAGYFASYAGHPYPEGGRVSREGAKILIDLGGSVHSYDGTSADETARAQFVIYSSSMPAEDKPRAHFASGYFWGMVGGE